MKLKILRKQAFIAILARIGLASCDKDDESQEGNSNTYVYNELRFRTKILIRLLTNLNYNDYENKNI